jgi:hypothetical protein
MGNLVVGEREHPMDRTRLTTAQVLIIIAVVALVVALALLEALAGREHAVDTDRTWESAIAKLDSALERGDTTGAIRAWHDAYLAAFVSRRWEGMVEVGDAAVRIGAIARSSEYWQPRAREAYLAAMFRARAHHSLEGVLRAAEGFGALGDRRVVEVSMRVARSIAQRDAESEARVEQFATHWNNQFLVLSDTRVDPF